jgi:hypothetical protein
MQVTTEQRFVIPKSFTIDMEKVNESKDINEKLNALFAIFSGLSISITDSAMTEDLRKFTKELK